MKPTTRPSSPRATAAWWTRLLLVVVLIADLVGAPLHRHHHDAGVDSSSLAVETEHAAAALQPHVEKNGEPSVFHATTALRAEPRSVVPALPVLDDHEVAALLPTLIDSLQIDEPEPTGSFAPSDRRPPPRPIPLSRPPEGRAPPARA